MEEQEYLISSSGRMDDVKQRNTCSCPFMRGLVPASSNCFTWAFTPPILTPPLDSSAMFWREREGRYHIEEQYHIPAGSLERPRFKMCFPRRQSSSAGGRALVTVCECQEPRQALAVLDTAPMPAGWDGAELCWERKEGPCCLGRAPGDAGCLNTLLRDSPFQLQRVKIILGLWCVFQGRLSLQL